MLQQDRAIVDRAADKPRKKSARQFRVRSPNNRRKVTNGVKLLPGLDGRSSWSRRFHDLCASHAQDAGGPDTLSEAQISLIRRASALEVTLERLELDMAEGREVDLDQYSRSAGHLRRILETVGVKRVAKDVSPMTLADLVKRHRASEAAKAVETLEGEAEPSKPETSPSEPPAPIAEVS
jgi:hypothetical protein